MILYALKQTISLQDPFKSTSEKQYASQEKALSSMILKYIA